MFRKITDQAILDQLIPYGNLRKANLMGANLEGIRMNNAILDDAILVGANLAGANLRKASLIAATIENAHFERAYLEKSYFQGIIFNNAHFEEARCNKINFYGSIIDGAHFERAIFIGGTFFDNVVFGQSYFEEANFTRATFTDCTFNNTNFMAANFTRATFTDCTFNNIIFMAANFTRSTFTNCTFDNTNFMEANFTRSIFINCLCNNNANFTGANFRHVYIDENTFFTEGLSDDQRAQISLLTEEVHHVGVAFEIHNFFSMLNIERISEYLNNYNQTHADEVNPNTISVDVDEHLFTPLLAFIDNSDLFLPDEKDLAKHNLRTRILPRIYGSNDNMRFENLFKVIDFVSRQNDNFIEQYIRIYINDCIFAYAGSSQTDSCTKGLIQRIVTTLNVVATNFLLDSENVVYREVQQLFIVFNDIVQEWAEKYLEGGEHVNELIRLTELQKKQHFINYMRQKYGELLTESIEAQIQSEANNYFEVGVFERMAFGLRRKINKKTKKMFKTKHYTKKFVKNKKKKLTKRK